MDILHAYTIPVQKDFAVKTLHPYIQYQLPCFDNVGKSCPVPRFNQYLEESNLCNSSEMDLQLSLLICSETIIGRA